MDGRIYQLLHVIGLTANYTGYRQIAVALEIALEEPEALCMVTKRLYPEIASRCGTSWKAVERNIRTVIRCIWNQSPHLLEQMIGYSIKEMPKPAQFLAVLAYGLSDRSSSDWDDTRKSLRS